jgi:hypothetical protein
MVCAALAGEGALRRAVAGLVQPGRQTLASNVLGCHRVSSVKLRLFTTQ